MTDGSRVLVALRVPVTAPRAFAAFTGQIAEWWQPNGLFPFTEDRTGTLAFEPGPTGRLVETYADDSSFVVGHIRTWDPGAPAPLRGVVAGAAGRARGRVAARLTWGSLIPRGSRQVS